MESAMGAAVYKITLSSIFREDDTHSRLASGDPGIEPTYRPRRDDPSDPVADKATLSKLESLCTDEGGNPSVSEEWYPVFKKPSGPDRIGPARGPISDAVVYLSTEHGYHFVDAASFLAFLTIAGKIMIDWRKTRRDRSVEIVWNSKKIKVKDVNDLEAAIAQVENLKSRKLK